MLFLMTLSRRTLSRIIGSPGFKVSSISFFSTTNAMIFNDFWIKTVNTDCTCHGYTKQLDSRLDLMIDVRSPKLEIFHYTPYYRNYIHIIITAKPLIILHSILSFRLVKRTAVL